MIKYIFKLFKNLIIHFDFLDIMESSLWSDASSDTFWMTMFYCWCPISWFSAVNIGLIALVIIDIIILFDMSWTLYILLLSMTRWIIWIFIWFIQIFFAWLRLLLHWLGWRGSYIWLLLCSLSCQDFIWVDVFFLHFRFEIFRKLLAFRHWSPSLLIYFNNFDILILSCKHQLFWQLITTLTQFCLQRWIFFHLFYPISISQSIKSRFTATQSWWNICYHCSFTVAHKRIFQNLSKLTTSEWQMILFPSRIQCPDTLF